jgi:hypothetical protein
LGVGADPEFLEVENQPQIEVTVCGDSPQYSAPEDQVYRIYSVEPQFAVSWNQMRSWLSEGRKDEKIDDWHV